jgi:glutamyl-tRNA synthetase
LSELIEHFSLDHIGKKGAIFDFEKLAWVNSVYLKAMTDEELFDAIVCDIDSHFATRFNFDVDTIKRIIALYKERVKTLQMLAQEVALVHDGPTQYHQEDMQKWIASDTALHLDAMIGFIEQQDILTHDNCAAIAKDLAASLGIKLVTLLQPIRLAIIGKASGPGVFDLLAIIGRVETVARLKALRATL